MEYNTPKPTKKKVSFNDRLLKNPITTIIGLACIIGAVYMYKQGLDETFAMILGCAGLVGLGLKDKS